MNYAKHSAFAHKYQEQMKAVIRYHWGEIVGEPEFFDCTGDLSDLTQATDLIVKTRGGSFLLRVRECAYRDLTLRVRSRGGGETEYEKVIKGHGEFYFYCWVAQGGIVDFMVVNMERLRASGLLEMKREVIDNGDGTAFIAISKSELSDASCIILTHFMHLQRTFKERQCSWPDHEWHDTSDGHNVKRSCLKCGRFYGYVK